MKVFLCCVLICAARLGAAEPDQLKPSATPVPSDSSAAPAEQEFHDPFASEDAKTPPKVSDPLERVNRAFFKFNDRLYYWVLKPVAKGYNKVAPEPFRESIRRLFVNARYPVRAVNNLLQGKFKGFGIETTRFVVNSTVGIGGLFDPANDEWHLQPYPEDLDQTLGFYRLRTGPYIHWPLLGPSSVRGTVGMVGDGFLSPWTYVDGIAVLCGTKVYDTINATSLRLGEYESFKKATFDPYVALRDAYLENTRSLVNQ